MVPTVFIVSLLIFIMIRLIPGSIIDIMVTRMYSISEQTYAEIAHNLGLDVPIYTQFGRWWGVLPQPDGVGFSGILQGSLGTSLWKGTPVIDEILVRVPVTLELGLLSMIIANLIGLPIGIFSAIRQDSWGDYIARSVATLAIALPAFWLGTMIIVFPSIWWGYMAPLRYVPFFEDPIVNLQIIIPPALVLSMMMMGSIMRMTRSMMLEVLRQDYIRTAWAKGFGERVIVLRHALKNSLIPVITWIGLFTNVVLGGTIIIEEIFGLPGLGRLIVNSVLVRDYPIVSGVVFIFAIAIVLINLVTDLINSFIDPRVRVQ